jgi:hypothetical protein
MKKEIGLFLLFHLIKYIHFFNYSFDYEVYVTADNSIFTCYSFLWKSENDYQIVVQPGQIMKGSRIKSDESNSSGKIINMKIFSIRKSFVGEPLLVQKRTATSSNSRPNTSTSATFDQVDQSSDATSTDENASAQNRNERSPVNFLKLLSKS